MLHLSFNYDCHSMLLKFSAAARFLFFSPRLVQYWLFLNPRACRDSEATINTLYRQSALVINQCLEIERCA